MVQLRSFFAKKQGFIVDLAKSLTVSHFSENTHLAKDLDRNLAQKPFASDTCQAIKGSSGMIVG